MSFFAIEKHSKVIIYGAGQMGRMCYEKLRQWCQVIAFFDMHPENVRLKTQIPVCRPFAEENERYDRQAAVILCLHSSSVHDEVAEKLYRQGYRHILFVPENRRIYDMDAMRQMQKRYCLFLEEDYASLTCIPDYERMTKIGYRAHVIRSSDKYVTTLISSDLLYTGGGKQPDQEEMRKHPDCPGQYRLAYDIFGTYVNKPLVMFQLYRDLFRTFLTGEGEVFEYVKQSGQIQNKGLVSEDAFLLERFEVFRILEQKYEAGPEGFYDCPVEADRNPRGYFETIDGNHRAMYLYCKKCNRIPVRMTAEDYQNWMNRKEAQKLISYIEKYHNPIFFAPVQHPLFIDRPYYGKEYLQKNLECVFEFLGAHQPYADLRLIDLGEDNGYFARCFWQLGIRQAVAVEEKARLCELDTLCSRLLTGREEIEVRYYPYKYDFEGTFDMAYIYDPHGIAKLLEIIPVLEQKISTMVICFCPLEQENDGLKFSDSKFGYCRLLRKTFTGSRVWALWAFCKNSVFEIRHEEGE